MVKSAAHFGATLITGRAGTGKTALAVGFARQYKKINWLSIDAGDCDWRIFKKYFAVSFLGKNQFDNLADSDSSTLSQEEISRFLIEIFTQISEDASRDDSLLVLDGLHYIFDTAWFGDFFNLLLCSLLPDTKLLMLCRSRPPFPLWRMRSKQILNVVDEKLLALNADETEMLYRTYGLPVSDAEKAHQKSFGRISKLVTLADKI